MIATTMGLCTLQSSNSFLFWFSSTLEFFETLVVILNNNKSVWSIHLHEYIKISQQYVLWILLKWKIINFIANYFFDFASTLNHKAVITLLIIILLNPWGINFHKQVFIKNIVDYFVKQACDIKPEVKPGNTYEPMLFYNIYIYDICCNCLCIVPHNSTHLSIDYLYVWDFLFSNSHSNFGLIIYLFN